MATTSADLSRQDYRRQFGMVLQDAWLYEERLRETSRFGNLEATDEEIIKAEKSAQCRSTLSSLAALYTTWR